MHYLIFIALIIYYKQEIFNLIIFSSITCFIYICIVIFLNNKTRKSKNNRKKVNNFSRANKPIKNGYVSINSETPAKGLIIKSPYIDKIIMGTKTWEMRATNTKQRGSIALIKKGSGQIVGLAKLVDTKGPLSHKEKLDNIDKHQISVERLKSGETEKWNVAWILEDVIKMNNPISYNHPNGAVIWVNLELHTQNEIAAFLKSKR